MILFEEKFTRLPIDRKKNKSTHYFDDNGNPNLHYVGDKLMANQSIAEDFEFAINALVYNHLDKKATITWRIELED